LSRHRKTRDVDDNISNPLISENTPMDKNPISSMPSPSRSDRAMKNSHQVNWDKSIPDPDDKSNPTRHRGNTQTIHFASNFRRQKPPLGSNNQSIGQPDTKRVI
jgi:hypothetical protein